MYLSFVLFGLLLLMYLSFVLFWTVDVDVFLNVVAAVVVVVIDIMYMTILQLAFCLLLFLPCVVI